MPISLSYHGGGGIRVDEEASWVGLGWSLNAGGAITRSLRGKDDLTYYNQNTIPVPSQGFGFSRDCTIPGYNANIDQRDAAPIEWDPDVFFFNFLSTTGKFVLQQQFVNGQAVVTPRVLNQQKIRIEYPRPDGDPTHQYFQVTTADGYHYDFAAVEESNVQGIFNPSAWYLTKITSPTGEVVTFVYDYGPEIIPVSPVSIIDTKAYEQIPPTFTFHDLNWTITHISPVYLSRIEYKTGYVQFIREQSTARQDMRGGQRLLGMQVFEQGQTTPLKEFTFGSSYTTSPTESFDPNSLPGGTGVASGGETTYSLNAEEHRYAASRLQLDQLTESGQGITKPPYRFSYNSRALPYKTSYQRDHWGFFNGADNNSNPNFSLVPAYKGMQTGLSTNYVELTGANREPNPTAAKAGLLEAIQYPTGGTTRFVYEGNEYGNLTQQEQLVDVPMTAQVAQNWNSGDSQVPVVASFTIPVNSGLTTLMHMSLRFSAGTIANNAAAPCGNSSIDLYQIISGQADKLVTNWPMCNYLPSSSTPSPYAPDFYLTGGTYELRTRIAPSDFSTRGLFEQAQLNWTGKTPQTDVSLLRKPGPGVRIAKVIDFDGINLASQTARPTDQIREYKYDKIVEANGPKSVSQGIIMSHPRYDRLKEQWFYVPYPGGYTTDPGGGDPGSVYFSRCFQLCSYSTVQLSSAAQGSPIGYSQVEEWQGSGASGGKTVYAYNNAEDQSPPTAIGSVPTLPYPLNGYVATKTDYQLTNAGTYQQVKEETNTYAITNQTSIPGVVKELERPNRYIWQGSLVEAFCESPLYYYYLLTQWVQLTDKRERVFNSQDATQYLETATHYGYDTGNNGHMQLSRTETSRSDGSTWVTQNTYPADYPSVTSGALAAMRTDQVYQHSNVVESISQLIPAGGQAATVDGHYTEYAQLPATGKYLPITVSALELAQPSTTIGLAAPALPAANTYVAKQHLSYDSQTGNLQQVQKEQDVPTSYLWSYGNTLPVAAIQNASTSQVQAALTALGIDLTQAYTEPQLRTAFGQLRQQLPQARVTSYTYRPLVGMTSQTDASGRTITYEYDGLCRLLRTRDEQGRILTQQEYHYAQ